jgi:hypothetical protein
MMNAIDSGSFFWIVAVDWPDVLSFLVPALVAIMVAIIAMVCSSAFRTVALETLKHPLKRTEIKRDNTGKVIEIKVADGAPASNRTTQHKALLRDSKDVTPLRADPWRNNRPSNRTVRLPHRL